MQYRVLRHGLLGCAIACAGACVDRSFPGETSDSAGNGSSTSNANSTGVDGTETSVGESSTGAPAPACAGGLANYLAVATVNDTGAGITDAPVTIENCTERPAYVWQDCCYGPAHRLERRDTADLPWEMASPSSVCGGCAGPVEPLVIDANGEITISTCPPCFDAIELCELGSARYRWTFLVGPEPDCEDCWELVTTNEISWYCEG